MTDLSRIDHVIVIDLRCNCGNWELTVWVKSDRFTKESSRGTQEEGKQERKKSWTQLP